MPRNTPSLSSEQEWTAPTEGDSTDLTTREIQIYKTVHKRTVIRRTALGENIRLIAKDLGISPTLAMNIIWANWDEYIAFLDRLDAAAVEVHSAVHLLALLPQRGTTDLHRRKVKEKMGLTGEVGNSTAAKVLAIQKVKRQQVETEDAPQL